MAQGPQTTDPCDLPGRPRQAYHCRMSSILAPLEDSRGIDVSLIRAKLRLTPAERVTELVAIVRTIQAVRSRVPQQSA